MKTDAVTGSPERPMYVRGGGVISVNCGIAWAHAAAATLAATDANRECGLTMFSLR
jgi:hypothetical protein